MLFLSARLSIIDDLRGRAKSLRRARGRQERRDWGDRRFCPSVVTEKRLGMLVAAVDKNPGPSDFHLPGPNCPGLRFFLSVVWSFDWVTMDSASVFGRIPFFFSENFVILYLFLDMYKNQSCTCSCNGGLASRILVAARQRKM